MPVTCQCENSKTESQTSIEKEHLSVSKGEQMGGQISTSKKNKFQEGCDSNCYLCHSQKIASTSMFQSVKKRRRSYENDSISSAAERQIPLKKLRVNELYSSSCGRNSLMAAFFRLLGSYLFVCMYMCVQKEQYFNFGTLHKRQFNSVFI